MQSVSRTWPRASRDRCRIGKGPWFRNDGSDSADRSWLSKTSCHGMRTYRTKAENDSEETMLLLVSVGFSIKSDSATIKVDMVDVPRASGVLAPG